ncbi:DUF3630 family protein [Enterovibrio nigricans]|uniref:Uncharacterized protein n=1 Tax=Enterovibrio nigricans DSM 22720 TaxID=1121868 RepID=A0A1T4UA21_9GAMM|nr:DUF3630 family protein [Enterovibrio nigricans]PKF51376.1 DUF3630 domain-containing protein [Enterovibrio nigricans]SKA49460.1 Protein of unknown function [Enterovibrio nigricans DSM 22720]
MDNALFSLSSFDAQEGRLVLAADGLDFDNTDAYLDALCQMIDARVFDKQIDADLHSWLVDFEGVRFMLRGEHYSASIWLEMLDAEGKEELAFLHGWLRKRLSR